MNYYFVRLLVEPKNNKMDILIDNLFVERQNTLGIQFTNSEDIVVACISLEKINSVMHILPVGSILHHEYQLFVDAVDNNHAKTKSLELLEDYLIRNREQVIQFSNSIIEIINKNGVDVYEKNSSFGIYNKRR